MKMYCGSNPTARLSQEQLAKAMFRLLAEKPFSAISVSELCREAGISRQTFYSLFDSRESVITYTLTEYYCYTPEPEAGCGTLREICANYAEYLLSHTDFLRTLEENDLVYLLYDGYYASLLDCGCFLPDRPQEVRAYAADFMAGGFTSIARAFLRSGGATDPTLLKDLIYGLFNGQLLTAHF